MIRTIRHKGLKRLFEQDDPSGVNPGHVAKLRNILANASCRSHRCSYEHAGIPVASRSEEHTSELQSLRHLVCRLLLEKKKVPVSPAIRHVALMVYPPESRMIRVKGLSAVYFFFLMKRRPPRSTLFPYTPLFR